MPPLTEDQRQHILALLENGENLPIEYKHLLFPLERQEYELVYAGKEREEDIIAETMAVPLQPIRTFGGNGTDWHNMLIFGDNLQAMKTLLQMKERGELVNADGTPGVRLIYIDPPFATRREFQGSKEQKAYQDKIVGAQFLEFLRKRIVILRELLSPNGSIYIHLDWKKVHAVKVLADEVFGDNNFVREIIWRIGWVSGYKSIANNWIRNHETLLFYSADPAQMVFNKKYVPYPKGYERWGGRPKGKGLPIEDVWGVFEKEGVTSLQVVSFASQDTGYPTQKPEGLIARVVEASSGPGDLVLDAFAGSGTTPAVAEKLGRRWIAIDSGKFAVYTMQRRMLTLRKKIGNSGNPIKPKPFTLYNAGLYDFARLRELPWEGWRTYALSLFQCKDVPHKASGIALDGYRGSDDVLVFNHRLGGGVVLDYGFIEDLHAQLRGRAGARFFIIAPAASVTFLEDYVEKGRTCYYILRIPYSIINELHSRDFSALIQPVDETQVNATVEAVGFDFIRQPKVACEYSVAHPEGELFKNAVVQIQTFQSQALAKGASQKGNLETLSMVLVDYDYPYNPARTGKEAPPPFEVDAVFYASEIQAAGWEICMPVDSLGKSIMLVYVDIYGNEYTEIKTPADFGIKKKAR